MSEELEISAIEQYVIDFVFKLRRKRKLKQADIATIIGVGRTFITNIENGKNRAKYNLSHIDKLASHFGLSPQIFLPQESLYKVVEAEGTK
jgi:transcriptional regulator with XRE-family HTH domain